MAALLVAPLDGGLRRHVHVQAAGMLLVALLTQLTYPWGAYGIMAIPLGSGPETSVLVLRNLLLVALTGHSFVLTLRATGRGAGITPVRGRASSPQPS